MKPTKPKSKKDLWVEMSIREIWTQARFAEVAYSHINIKAAVTNDALFSSIHSFLSHSAMMSKMLVATYDGSASESIGDLLDITGSSVIHSRTFRNHLEHYDERIKQWVKSSPEGSNIGTYNIGPKTAIQIPNMIFVSHYDPTNNTFTFVNDDFDLSELYEEVLRVKNIVDDWVKTHFYFPKMS